MECKNCSEQLKQDECIKCATCQCNYHHLCVGLLLADFKKILPMNKARWKCPGCKSSKKTSSNSPHTSNTSEIDNKSLYAYFDERFNLLDSSIKSFKNLISDELKKVTDTVNKWSSKITHIELSIQSVVERVNGIDLEMAKIHHLEQEVSKLNSTIKDLKDNHDRSEQWVRRSNIQINGVPYKKGEDLIKFVKNLAEKCNFSLNPNTDIDFVTRVATKNDMDVKKPKPIILKMQARYKKDDFLSSLRKLRNFLFSYYYFKILSVISLGLETFLIHPEGRPSVYMKTINNKKEEIRLPSQ